MKKLLLVLILVALIFPVVMAEDTTIIDGGIPEGSGTTGMVTPTAEPTAEPKPTVTIEAKPTISILSEATVEWKQVSDTGVSESVAPTLVKTKLSPTTMLFKAYTGSKSIQVNALSTVTVSQDTETVLQKSESPESPKVELYYGYQKSSNHPWSHYYKIEKCDATQCRVVRADFATRNVWIEYITVSAANTLTGMVKYEDLPVAGGKV